MNRFVLTLCSALAVAGFTARATEAAPTPVTLPPLAWKTVGQAEMSEAAGVLSVTASARTSGITGTVRIEPRRRYECKFEIRGEGKAQCGVNGSFGWVYGKQRTLNSEWQHDQLTFTDSVPAVAFTIYNTLSSPTRFEVRNFSITPLPPVELTAAEIPPRLFLPADYPGTNGKLRKVADAVGGSAMWGKRWYCVMLLPVPANSQDLYYYAHLSANTSKPMEAYLLGRPHIQRVSAIAKFTAASGWSWVKLGPISAAIAHPEAFLSYNGDPATEILVDKVVLATDGNLTPEALDKVE